MYTYVYLKTFSGVDMGYAEEGDTRKCTCCFGGGGCLFVLI